eukprot:1155701-Pelagomonas_calceolata.AAC.1
MGHFFTAQVLKSGQCSQWPQMSHTAHATAVQVLQACQCSQWPQMSHTAHATAVQAVESGKCSQWPQISHTRHATAIQVLQAGGQRCKRPQASHVRETELGCYREPSEAEPMSAAFVQLDHQTFKLQVICRSRANRDIGASAHDQSTHGPRCHGQSHPHFAIKGWHVKDSRRDV